MAVPSRNCINSCANSSSSSEFNVGVLEFGGKMISCAMLKEINICVAVAQNGVIGKNNQIPWPRLR